MILKAILIIFAMLSGFCATGAKDRDKTNWLLWALFWMGMASFIQEVIMVHSDLCAIMAILTLIAAMIDSTILEVRNARKRR